MKTLVICSGGLDSMTLAHKIAKEGELNRLVTFDYGQRHKTEIEYAKLCADKLNVPHDIVDISNIGSFLTGSSLTDDIDIPEGHYAQDNMKSTIVPNRNAIMLSIAYGIAAANNIDIVATAVHGGDHFIYPDCRPDFIKSFEKMQNFALDGYSKISLYTPFVNISKSKIVEQGNKMGVKFEDSWSCYKGGDVHCGRCGTCVERIEAFSLANIKDPTKYLDNEFWKQAVNKD